MLSHSSTIDQRLSSRQEVIIARSDLSTSFQVATQVGEHLQLISRTSELAMRVAFYMFFLRK